MTPEGKVKDRIKKILRLRKVYYCMPRGTALGRSGVPDFLCCYRGFFFAIEAKAGSNKPTPLQSHEIQAIQAAGGLASVINEDNVAEVDALLNAIDIAVGKYAGTTE